jgi:hypothetical protein
MKPTERHSSITNFKARSKLRRHGSDQPFSSGTAVHRGDRTSTQRVTAVCRS